MFTLGRLILIPNCRPRPCCKLRRFCWRYRFGRLAHGNHPFHHQTQPTRLVNDAAWPVGCVGVDATGLCKLHATRSGDGNAGVGAIPVGGRRRCGDEPGLQMAATPTAGLASCCPCHYSGHRGCVVADGGIRPNVTGMRCIDGRPGKFRPALCVSSCLRLSRRGVANRHTSVPANNRHPNTG